MVPIAHLSGQGGKRVPHPHKKNLTVTRNMRAAKISLLPLPQIVVISQVGWLSIA